MSDYAEDRFHRKLDAALGRLGERDDRLICCPECRSVFEAEDHTLASDWLDQRIEQAKAEERERIARAVEADQHLFVYGDRGRGWAEATARAARIAREVPHA